VSPADPALIAATAERILETKRPVLIAGNGVRIAQAYEELRAVAELAGLPVATTAAGNPARVKF
jgi:acetolactate synthase I/II/III large subunit